MRRSPSVVLSRPQSPRQGAPDYHFALRRPDRSEEGQIGSVQAFGVVFALQVAVYLLCGIIGNVVEFGRVFGPAVLECPHAIRDSGATETSSIGSESG